ncbi:MAG: CorA family divalent cation transporter [Bacteroidales bacterium]|nr:CorA family divalent cation transporter [Bacteroidales bacterium]
MVRIFYRNGAEIVISQSETEFATFRKQDILWIDLVAPSGDEKRATESFLGVELQTRAQAEEIESSSRFSEDDRAIYANTNFLSPAGDEMSMDPVSFIISEGIITTVREIPLRSFDILQRKIQALPEQYPDGFTIFVEIMDKRVDLDADIVELISKDVSQFSKRINQKEDINEEFLLDINQLQENAMFVRENIVDKQRLISNLLKSKKFSKDTELREDMSIILQDIASLINHTNFTFERLEYLQDTVVGIINLDQNRIMKIFTFINLLLMPATLIASFYGMNVKLPFAEFSFTWIGIIGIMASIVAVVFIAFKKRRML